MKRSETLISGVVTGMTMTASHLSLWAERATPWAWFPAEEQMTPLSNCSGESFAIILYAPRNLNENTYNQVNKIWERKERKHRSGTVLFSELEIYLIELYYVQKKLGTVLCMKRVCGKQSNRYRDYLWNVYSIPSQKVYAHKGPFSTAFRLIIRIRRAVSPTWSG